MKVFLNLFVVGAAALMLLSSVPVAASFVFVDDMSNLSDWTSVESGTTWVSDGDVATMSRDCLGGSWSGWAEKDGLNISLADYPVLQIMARKAPQNANSTVWMNLRLFNPAGVEFIGTGWVPLSTTETNYNWSLAPWSDQTIAKAIYVITANAPVGTVSTHYTDFILLSAATDPIYFNDPVVPEPASVLALASGLLGFVGFLRRRTG